MNFPKAELSKQDALHLWITCRSEYAKEQMILTNYGIVFFCYATFRNSSV